MTELKQCPWCRSDENLKVVRGRDSWRTDTGCFSVKCKCGREGPSIRFDLKFGASNDYLAEEAKEKAIKAWNKPVRSPTKNDEKWEITISAHTKRRSYWPDDYKYYHTVKGDTLEETIQLAREKLSELADEEAWLGVEQIYEARLDCITERLEAA